MTYNPLQRRWQYLSIDTRATIGLMYAQGTGRDEGPDLTLYFNDSPAPTELGPAVEHTVWRCFESSAERFALAAFGIKGKGQEVTFRVADIFALRDGKITAHWEVADTGPLAQLAASEMPGGVLRWASL